MSSTLNRLSKLTLRKGQKSTSIEYLQTVLCHLGFRLVVDGAFGEKTANAVKVAQARWNLGVDGIVGRNTWKAIRAYVEMTKDKPFIVADAGHGDYRNGVNYTPARDGKRYKHNPNQYAGHDGKGTFYEGAQNRIAVNTAANLFGQQGIRFIIVSHPYKNENLNTRVWRAVRYYQLGYRKFFVHSFHSNAASGTAQGLRLFTTDGKTISDELSKEHIQSWMGLFPNYWVGRRDDRHKEENTATTSSDWEAMFYILRYIERYTNLDIAVQLEEFGFFDNIKDVIKIVDPVNTYKRALALYWTFCKYFGITPKQELLQPYLVN